MCERGFRIALPSRKQANRLPGSMSSDLGTERMSIEHGDAVQRIEWQSYTVLLDGYVFGCEIQTLVVALVNQDDSILSDVNGGFTAVVIDSNGGVVGHCDRLGMRTIFWQTSEGAPTVIWSRWEDIAPSDTTWNPDGLGELLHYRWMSGTDTAISQVSKLPIWHRLTVDPSGDLDIRPTRQCLSSPSTVSTQSLSENATRTRNAIERALATLSGQHSDIAVYLSGGVDSSLLAALAARHFDNCVLVSPIFEGSANPELPAAKAFAESLGLQHILVNIDGRCLVDDLNNLIRRKGGQINFHTLAMLQLNRALPREYNTVIHGEAADTLFGLNRFDRAITLLRRKRILSRLPRRISGLLKVAANERLRQLGCLAELSYEELAVQHHSIKYDDKARDIIDGISNAFSFVESSYTAVTQNRSVLEARQLTPRLRTIFQQVALATEVANHMQEICLAGRLTGKQVFTPFLVRELITIATSLPSNQYSGEITKPILRELACQHYDRDLIYTKKYGFYVPYVRWLEGPFSELVSRVRKERELFDGRSLDRIDLQDGYPLYWALVNLLVLRDTLDN